MKTCIKCNIEKDFDTFYKSKVCTDGHDNICKLCKKEYQEKNKNKIKDYKIKYREVNKEKISRKRKIYKQEKLKTDMLFKLKHGIRALISNSMKSVGVKKQNRTNEILGCSIIEFKLHLESKFEPWMNWDNKGKYNGKLNFGWDIDHITPSSSASSEKDIIELNHYTNLQPLCSYVNRCIKRNTIKLNDSVSQS